MLAALGVWVAHTPMAETLMLKRRRRGRVISAEEEDAAVEHNGESKA
jgi:hypothetical protein